MDILGAFCGTGGTNACGGRDGPGPPAMDMRMLFGGGWALCSGARLFCTVAGNGIPEWILGFESFAEGCRRFIGIQGPGREEGGRACVVEVWS